MPNAIYTFSPCNWLIFSLEYLAEVAIDALLKLFKLKVFAGFHSITTNAEYASIPKTKYNTTRAA